MQSLIEVKDLRVHYGDYEAVRGVSFSLGKGEILGIVGESGSGKSTIAKVVMGLEKASSGSVCFGWEENPARRKNRRVQMIFQDAVGSLNPRMTVRQTLEEVLKQYRQNRNLDAKNFGREGQKGREGREGAEKEKNLDGKFLSQSNTKNLNDIPTLLSIVGLSQAVLDQYPREMSGGQCQRVSIARALACSPQVLVADEPVSALDVSVQARILNLLRDLRRDLGLSILLIAHDLAVVKNVCDRICVMEKGRFVDVGDAAEVFSHPSSDYTKRLLTAVPRIDL